MNIASRAKLFFVIIFFCIPILVNAQQGPVGSVSSTSTRSTGAAVANQNTQTELQKASAAVAAAQKEYDDALLTRDNTKINNARTKLNQAKQAQTNASATANNSQVSNSTGASQAIASAQARQAQADQAESVAADTCGVFSFSWSCFSDLMLGLFQGPVITIAGTILYLSNLVFDYSIYFSIIRFGDFLGSTPLANASDPNSSSMYATWTIIRNLFNIIIVFQLLKFSIYKIIGRGGDSEFKKSIIAIIIFALFTNFSFFFTKALIDVSNIVTLQFYAAAGGDPTPGEFNQSNITKSIMQTFSIQNVIYNDNSLGNISGAEVAKSVRLSGEKVEPFANTFTGTIVIFFMMLVASFVLLQGAAIFIARAVALIFVVMFSPLMFAKDIFGPLDKISKQWWDMLLEQLYVAPAYLGLLFLTLKLAGGGTGLLYYTKSGFNVTNATNTLVESFFSFAIISGLLVGCVTLAKRFGGLAAKRSSAWGAAAYGSVVGGGASYLGRKTAGRLADRYSNSERLKTWAAEDTVRGAAARRTISLLDSTKTASFDFRNSDTLKRANSAAGKYGLDLKDAGKGTGVGGFVKERSANEDARKKAFNERVKLVNVDTSRMGDAEKKKAEAANTERRERFLRNKSLTGREKFEDFRENTDGLTGTALTEAERRNEVLEKDFKKAQGLINRASTVVQDVRFKAVAGEKTNYAIAKKLSEDAKKESVKKRQANDRDADIKKIATKEEVLDSSGNVVEKDRDLPLTTEQELEIEFNRLISEQKKAVTMKEAELGRSTDATEKADLDKQITEHKKEIRKLTNRKGSIKNWVKAQEAKEKEAEEKKGG